MKPLPSADAASQSDESEREEEGGFHIYDVYIILGILDPLSFSLSTKSTLFVRKFAAVLHPTPPFSADVLYGSLRRREKERTNNSQTEQSDKEIERKGNAMVQWPDDVSFRTLLVSVLTVGLSYEARDIYNHTL